MALEVERIDTLPQLAARPADSHKGTAGRVLVVGGSRGLIGAVALTANGALRGGAGLVMVAAPQCVQPYILGLAPCATSHPLPCRGDRLDRTAVTAVRAAAARNDVLAVGPGFSTGVIQRMIVRAVLGLGTPAVLDADGLNNLANTPDWPAQRRGPLVLTPHPGEMARLTGRSIGEVQADRTAAAVSAVRGWTAAGQGPLVLVLKGAGTVVTDGARLYVNRTGNPGMATGGTGDVLTGLLAALIGQGLAAFDAACLAVHLHGLAGDIAADRVGQVSLIATDLLETLPAAFARHADGP